MKFDQTDYIVIDFDFSLSMQISNLDLLLGNGKSAIHISLKAIETSYGDFHGDLEMAQVNRFIIKQLGQDKTLQRGNIQISFGEDVRLPGCRSNVIRIVSTLYDDPIWEVLKAL